MFPLRGSKKDDELEEGEDDMDGDAMIVLMDDVSDTLRVLCCVN